MFIFFFFFIDDGAETKRRSTFGRSAEQRDATGIAAALLGVEENIGEEASYLRRPLFHHPAPRRQTGETRS